MTKKTALESRILNRKRYIIDVLKKAGKYSPDLAQQVDIAAKLYVRLHEYERRMSDDEYEILITETSREGHARVSVNPLEATYKMYLEQYQAALRALGMNADSKGRKQSSDALGAFMKKFEGDD